MDKQTFFAKMEEQGLALTFDDVTLTPGYSEVGPRGADVSTKLTRNITLKIPIVSAAMDTITEHRMAIALAKAGGIGVIHQRASCIEQVKLVAKVKHHLHGRIDMPIAVQASDTITQIMARNREKGYDFRSFPVLDNTEHLVGVLTGNDFDMCDDHTATARQVMSQDVITALFDISQDDAYQLMQKHKKKVLPLVDSERRLRGMYVLSDLKRARMNGSAVMNTDSSGRLRVAAAIGVGEEALARVPDLQAEGIDVIVIDTAHGATRDMVETIKEIRRMTRYNLDIIAGNVSAFDSAERLFKAGVDAIKVGQGPGSICTTRKVAGIGIPQLTAVHECVQAVEGKIPIIADGGIRSSGDITKAIAAGASSVMLGSMLAGTDEAPGETVLLNGRKWKKYRGMGSLGAMQSSSASRERYRQDEAKLIPEGVEGLEPYKGPAADVLDKLVGGLRSGMGYVGASTVIELQRRADFRRITAAGDRESHVHDVHVIQDAPNYELPR